MTWPAPRLSTRRADAADLDAVAALFTNVRAQALYESEGYARDAVFRVYVKEF